MASFASLIDKALTQAKTMQSSGAPTGSSLLQGDAAYQVNRERVATVLHEGFAVYDWWSVWKPRIFWGSLAGAAVSGFMLYRRRRKGPEAWTVWATSLAGCALTAWVTKPGQTVSAPPGSSQATFDVLGLIDEKRLELKAQDPNFADKEFTRFEQLPVVAQQLQAQPWLKAVM